MHCMLASDVTRRLLNGYKLTDRIVDVTMKGKNSYE